MEETIGERLKKSIKTLGITNKVFADKLGIAPNYVSMIISGKKSLSDSLKMSITKVIPELNLDWLETGSGEILNEPSSSLQKETYLEYLGVKVPLVIMIDHFVNNKEAWLAHPYMKLWREEQAEIDIQRRLKELQEQYEKNKAKG